MQVTKLLKEKGTEGLTYLTDVLGIKIKEYDELLVLNYSQIDSPKSDPIVMECRGLILDKNYDVVCRPLKRFFNMGEVPDITMQIDINDSDAFEKADGSLVKLYNFKENWYVGTRGTAFAESENYTGKVFANMIIEAFGFDSLLKMNDYFSNLDVNKSYMFEYISPFNRVVTPYKEDKMVLLAVLNRETGEEYNITEEIESFSHLNVRLPRMFTFNSREHVQDIANGLKDLLFVTAKLAYV